jgi:signal transduction histidine kinase
LVNTNLHAVVDDPRWERIVSSLRLAMTMGSAGQSAPPAPETTLCIRDHIIHAKLIPIYDSQTGAATIIATFLRDISAETEGWRARDEVLAALSKRMRSPMTAIASYSDLLLGGKMGVADSMQRRYLQRIRAAIEQLETALNELGQVSPSSDLRMTPVPTHPVIEVINQAVDAAQNVLSLEGVNIVRDIDDELPLVQVADAEYVVRTLADLLLAVGARTSFGDNVQVSTQVEEEDEQSKHLVLALTSKDAPGRELAPLEEDESISATIALAEDAGGRIWVERESDGGNRICFLLPAAESESSD